MLKRLLRRPAVSAWLARTLAAILGFCLSTTRWTLLGAEHFAPFEQGAPVIAAFWHEHLPLMPALWRRAQAATPGLRLHVLVSRHRDGRLIGEVIRGFGLDLAHGSSERGGQGRGGPGRGGQARGGATGAMTLLAALAAGEQVAITPDGPRGPRRVAAAGTARLAALSGCPVLPCAAATRRRLTLSSWDQMALPLPWGRGVLVCGPAIAVAPDVWEQDGGRAAVAAIAAGLDAASAAAWARCR